MRHCYFIVFIIKSIILYYLYNNFIIKSTILYYLYNNLKIMYDYLRAAYKNLIYQNFLFGLLSNLLMSIFLCAFAILFIDTLESHEYLND